MNESNNGDNLNENIKKDLEVAYECLETNGDTKTFRSEQDDFITVNDMLSHVISFATLSIKIVLRLVAIKFVFLSFFFLLIGESLSELASKHRFLFDKLRFEE